MIDAVKNSGIQKNNRIGIQIERGQCMQAAKNSGHQIYDAIMT